MIKNRITHLQDYQITSMKRQKHSLVQLQRQIRCRLVDHSACMSGPLVPLADPLFSENHPLPGLPPLPPPRHLGVLLLLPLLLLSQHPLGLLDLVVVLGAGDAQPPGQALQGRILFPGKERISREELHFQGLLYWEEYDFLGRIVLPGKKSIFREEMNFYL